MFLDSCDCTDGCTDRSKCACLRLTAKACNENSASPSNKASCGYRYKRLDGPVPSGIYECNLSCKCDRMRCQNRVAQHGIQVRLQVFNTDQKGWGVRCLDDIDKGTFVCTYSGRLMSRAEPREMGDVNREAEKKDAVNEKSPSSLSVKRKLDTTCSDSEIELVQTGRLMSRAEPREMGDVNREAEKKDAVNEKSPSSLSVKRKLDTTCSDSEIELVQTGKDSINRRCETLSQPADDEYKPVVSDEGDSSQPQPSTKTKLTTGTKKEKEEPKLQEKLGEQEEAMQSEPSITDTAKSKEKRPSPEDARGGKSARLDDAHAMKQSMGLLQRDDFKEEKNRRCTQDPLCNEEAEGDETPLKNSNKENIYLLDATKEGNVGRFLNVWGNEEGRGEPAAGGGVKRLNWALGLMVWLGWGAFRGDFHIMEKMVKRKCAFCPADEECAIMYIAEKQNLAVHQNCLLYSSGFVESEEHNPENQDTRFDVASVQSEIRRGKRLMCNFCRKKGATVGCEIKTCRRSYHYFCALCDDAALETDGGQGIYRSYPAPWGSFQPASMRAFPERGNSPYFSFLARIDFLRKCKQAGLLDGIFKEMLDTLHLAKEKLMDDNTSETEYEETVISLFDCSLFENILTNVHSGTEEKLQELLETRKRLDTQIELLKDLKEVIPFQENIASASSSVSE
ncbi:PHD finger protein 11 [Chelonia mydas]|uniref:PHD finger protein 11 n=1 Tax=Chelonia mydas TaxID=8469 RepID=M7AVZ9_CHEMY|nr:PHD finger protein 11 [Chelonia mydas]